jgi:hypothetical protein
MNFKPQLRIYGRVKKQNLDPRQKMEKVEKVEKVEKKNNILTLITDISQWALVSVNILLSHLLLRRN